MAVLYEQAKTLSRLPGGEASIEDHEVQHYWPLGCPSFPHRAVSYLKWFQSAANQSHFPAHIFLSMQLIPRTGPLQPFTAMLLRWMLFGQCLQWLHTSSTATRVSLVLSQSLWSIAHGIIRHLLKYNREERHQNLPHFLSVGNYFSLFLPYFWGLKSQHLIELCWNPGTVSSLRGCPQSQAFTTHSSHRKALPWDLSFHG